MIAGLSWANSAFAYCRTMSCELGEKPSNPCPRDQNQCVTAGKPLHWPSPCLSYTVQVDGSPLSTLDADQVQALAVQAFDAWRAARCPGGGSPRFEVQFSGYVSCDRREVICDSVDKNDHVIMFHDSGWQYGANRIGVTTPTGGKESGLLVDADVEINSQDFSFKSDANGMMSTSLLYVLTHELGHFLGLGHSSVTGAIMSTGYQSLPFSPNLISADDAAAICAVYPPGPPLECGAPRAAAYDQCQIPLGEDPPCQLASVTHDAGCGCRLAPSPNRAWPAFAGLSAWLILRTRRSRSKRTCTPKSVER